LVVATYVMIPLINCINTSLENGQGFEMNKVLSVSYFELLALRTDFAEAEQSDPRNQTDVHCFSKLIARHYSEYLLPVKLTDMFAVAFSPCQILYLNQQGSALKCTACLNGRNGSSQRLEPFCCSFSNLFLSWIRILYFTVFHM
jgi:hypothetical protein